MQMVVLIILCMSAVLSMLGILVEAEYYKIKVLTISFSVSAILLTTIYLMNQGG